MTSKIARLGIVALGAAVLAACSPHAGQRETGGTLLGAALGGLAGAHIGKGAGRVAAIAAGSMFGAVIGNNIGRSLDKADRLRVRQTAQRSLESSPSGKASAWRNPDSGNSGTFTPTRTIETGNGLHCREYQQTITVGGRTRQGYGTACRQPDGSWRIADKT